MCQSNSVIRITSTRGRCLLRDGVPELERARNVRKIIVESYQTLLYLYQLTFNFTELWLSKLYEI